MAKLQRVVGSTSVVLLVFAQDSSATTGAGLTGLAYNTASLTCYYKRNTASAAVAVTLADITTLGTFASSGFKAVDGTNMPGVYEFHPPDAAFASGARAVVFMLKGAANLAPVLIEVELTAVDNQATSFGLSLVKSTNITGFNDIAATAIVSGGAITTSGGKAAASLAAADVSGNVAADLQTIKAQTVTCSGGVTIPAATLASTTNITAGTITTVTTTTTATNLTNLPTMPTDWLTATGLAASAVTEIQSGLSTYAGGDTTGTATLLTRLSAARAGYLDALNGHIPQTGDSYPEVTSATYGLAKLVRSTTPANTLDVSATGEAGLDFSNVKQATAPTTLTNITMPTVTTLANLPTMPTDWLTAAGLAGDAVTEIQAGLATATALAAVSTNVSTVQGQTTTTGVRVLLSQTGLTPRALDSVADSALTLGDCLVAAACGAAGRGSVVGTAYTVKTPFTGTIIRTFALDSASSPTSRT